jgi:hypothetical protein
MDRPQFFAPKNRVNNSGINHTASCLINQATKCIIKRNIYQLLHINDLHSLIIACCQNRVNLIVNRRKCKAVQRKAVI